ncbi:dna-directed rna polymerase ii rpb9 [Cystoisospora suis]|uniref:Dna-directed rna polymerase ii rpb9 n=1 Tax=Cystoisospora suis TaxID=483139 RepID=A0A2C6KP67_9APIC|nr:dna-directed rna polymerase ii rpb9 [Cystoisospora suis]
MSNTTTTFCPECNNLLYPKEDRAKRQLMFLCRQCDYIRYAKKDDPDENTAERMAFNFKSKEDIRISMDLAKDPTLGRVSNWRCPKCGDDKAVFYQLSERVAEAMTLVYICITPGCGHWEIQARDLSGGGDGEDDEDDEDEEMRNEGAMRSVGLSASQGAGDMKTINPLLVSGKCLESSGPHRTEGDRPGDASGGRPSGSSSLLHEEPTDTYHLHPHQHPEIKRDEDELLLSQQHHRAAVGDESEYQTSSSLVYSKEETGIGGENSGGDVNVIEDEEDDDDLFGERGGGEEEELAVGRSHEEEEEIFASGAGHESEEEPHVTEVLGEGFEEGHGAEDDEAFYRSQQQYEGGEGGGRAGEPRGSDVFSF